MIFAGEGDDTINAGTGSNYVNGGAGADTFVVESGQTLTTIGDFTDCDDHIDLSNISGISAFSDLTITDDNGTGGDRPVRAGRRHDPADRCRHHRPGRRRLRICRIDHPGR